MQRQGNGLLPLLFLERKANMSDKLNTLEALRLASLKAKGYTAEQISALSSAMEDIIKDINDSLKTCEDHVQSAHAPANAEENVIVSIQRNGQAIPPDNKVVNIEVPTKTSALENDSCYATADEVQEKVNGAGHLKAVPVDALPAPSEANADTIYFLRKNNSEAGKQYRAYKLIHGIFEIVVHDMPKEQAMRYVDQLRDFYTAGWLKLIGQS